jgi:ornithine--oxo-acid transaminase
MSLTPNDYISREKKHLASNYKPLPVVLSRAEGVWMWDVEGNKYLDFLSAYSAVSGGHHNQRIIQAMNDQLGKIDVPSRAFYTIFWANMPKNYAPLQAWTRCFR